MTESTENTVTIAAYIDGFYTTDLGVAETSDLVNAFGTLHKKVDIPTHWLDLPQHHSDDINQAIDEAFKQTEDVG